MIANKLVLFVCVENSNRSQMAEAFARMHGGDGIEAASSGSRPSGRVNPRAVESTREVGYDLTTHISKSHGQFNGQEVAVAVTMGCGDECPLVKAARRATSSYLSSASKSANSLRRPNATRTVRSPRLATG